MRSTLRLLSLILISFTSFSQGNNQLVAHWNFNGSANDVSGNNLNGTVTGATLVQGYAGGTNTAYQFNGTSNHIDVAYNSLMNLDSFSICALVKPMGFYSGPCQGNYILERGTETANEFYSLGIFDNAYDLSCSIYSPTHEVFYSAGSTAPTSYWYYGNSVLVPGQWYCATVTYAADSAKVYVDGLLRTTVYWARSSPSGSDGLSIGYYQPGGSSYPYWFNGLMDDMRLYGRALSASEVITYCDSAKLGGLDTITINQPFLDTLLCAGQTFSLPYTAHITFNAGNIFTAVLSDSAGSFASSVNIGTLASTTSGSITCTIPSNTIPGNSYRIHIVSSSPVYTSYSDALDIKIIGIPAHSISCNSPLCVGDTLRFTNTATNVSMYSWSGPNSFTSSSSNPVIPNVTVICGGNYHVNDSFQNGCTAWDTILVAVNTVPTHSAGSNSPVCPGNTLIFTNSASAYSYHWSGPNNFNTMIQAPQISFVTSVNSGTYYVRDSFSNGCKAVDTVHVVVYTVPSHSLSSNSPLCAGDTLKFTNSVTGVSTYHWTGPNSFISSLQNPQIANIVGANSGLYTVVDTFTNGCHAQDTVHVTVNASVIPSVSITSIPVVVYAGQPATYHSNLTNCNGTPTYQWKLNGVNIPAATSSQYTGTIASGDHISLVVHCPAACTKPDSASSNLITTGIDELQNIITDLSLYPNPNKGSFTITGQINGKAASIEMLDMIGRAVYREDINIQNKELHKELYLNKAAGIYLIRIKCGDESKVLKLTLE